ncbi:hypothetical protein SISSUDRAFT_1032860 [Sistotremastrum suecicum HHB10207 ss-3]|nr:hypothetical protein SISSUDRAFT_1032860 [Sistotremastrum suecicum HHB10207 ss-3]
MTRQSLTEELAELAWTDEKIPDIICAHNGIDLSTRHGYKTLHKDFATALSRLDRCWDDHEGDHKVMAGIVFVYGTMAKDVLLRNQLHESGFLSKILLAVEHPVIQLAGLQALHIVFHHTQPDDKSTENVSAEMAEKVMDILVSLLQDELTDDFIGEFCISIFSHLFEAAISNSSGSNISDERMRYFHVSRIVNLALERIRIRGLELHSDELGHVLPMLTTLPFNARKAYFQNHSAINLIVACLRSTSLRVRCQGMMGLYRLEWNDTERYENESIRLLIKPVRKQDVPSVIKGALSEYGLERCEFLATWTTFGAMSKALIRCTKEGDLLRLGKDLAAGMLVAESSVPTGKVYIEDPASFDADLPFDDWMESLPLCAQALRTHKKFDMADIVELKYFMMTERWDDLSRLGQAAIARKPEIAFFYYAMASKGGYQAIKWATLGLKCQRLPPFIRWILLYERAVQAMKSAFLTLSRENVPKSRKEKGITCLKCAYHDLKAFVDGAPPDCCRMLHALNRLILISVVVKGQDLSPDLREISDILHKHELAEEIHKFFWEPDLPETHMSRVRVRMMQKLPKAAKQWRTFIERTSNMGSSEVELEEELLACAIDEAECFDEDDMTFDPFSSAMFADTNDKSLKLHRCANCSNSSAALRKCSRCGIVRYCNENW